MHRITFIVDTNKIKMRWHEKFSDASFPNTLYTETGNFKILVEKLWRDGEAYHLDKLEEITKLKPSGDYTISILPPQFEEAQYIDSHTIEWGYSEMYSGYTCIGLTHELLHCLTHNFYTNLSDDEKWIFHALVYLSIDEEFYRTRARTESYFTSPLLTWYHPQLIETARKLLPVWKEFFADSKHGSIFDVYASIKKVNPPPTESVVSRLR